MRDQVQLQPYRLVMYVPAGYTYVSNTTQVQVLSMVVPAHGRLVR
jgi:hypothetical protein